jgi:hypothetical protein
MLWWL